MVKLWAKLAGLALLASGIAACGGEKEQQRGTDGQVILDKTLRMNLAAKPEPLDPARVSGLAEHKVLIGLFDPLVRMDKDSKPVPGAAESWEPNEDFTAWTFNLRRDGKWHNGETVTATDFKYSIERLFTPSTQSKYVGVPMPHVRGAKEYFDAGGRDAGLSLDSIKTPDEYTLIIEMQDAAPYFITFVQLFSFMPVHRATVEASPERWAISPATYMGNGPFRMKEWRAGDRVVLEPSEHYWDRERIFWDEVVFLMIEDQNTENNAFINRQVDVTQSVAIPELAFWQTKPEFRSRPLLATYYVSFNTKVKPFDDPRVRKAFSMVIDRELITTRVTRRREPVARGLVPADVPSPTGGSYGDVAPNMIPERSTEAAMALLAEAGYGPGNPLPMVEYIYNNSEEHRVIGEQLQRMWKTALGVDVRLQNVEWATYVARMNNREFEFARTAWVGDYLDAMTFLEIYTTGNSKNSPQYDNPEYDALLNKARAEGDPVQRELHMINAERLLIERDHVVAPIYTYISPILVQQDVEGFDRNILGNYLYTYSQRVPR